MFNRYLLGVLILKGDFMIKKTQKKLPEDTGFQF